MLLTVIGARPQFIKAVSVSQALARRSVPEVLVHTGQHFDANMSDVFFEELKIPKPTANLGIHGGTHAHMTGQMMAALEDLIVEYQPRAVMVYGDTNSTLAGGLAAAKLQVPVIHVEAGLRSFDRAMPEELNRVLVDQISRLLFCPTEAAVTNLKAEGVYTGNRLAQEVRRNGDVMYDTFLSLQPHFSTSTRTSLGLEPGRYALATVHRASNTDGEDALREVFALLGRAAERVGRVVFPMHPRTRHRLKDLGLEVPAGVTLLEPVGYLDMMGLLVGASWLFTDSGGMQKEALWADVPCITLRENTEWVETVDAGFNVLVGRSLDKLEAAFAHFDRDADRKAARDALLEGYGGGQAADLIAERVQALVTEAA